mgnify:CR=1 FL=1
MLQWTAGAVVINLLLGIVLMLGGDKFMERRFPLGALTGIVVGTGVIYTQATV